MNANDDKSASPSHRLTASPSQICRWLGLIGILSIAVMRCVTVFSPHALFDTDPAADQVPLGGLAQAGSLWLDAGVFISCGIAMLGEWLAGRRLSILACVFALLPLPIVFWHGAHDAVDLWRGGTWAAAAIACVTIAHLARDRQMRIIIGASLLAVMAPLAVRGLGQVTWEHADTVRVFEDTRHQFFEQRGWSPDSSAAKIYERRLRQPQPTGWFTTSNIFAAAMIFGLIASLGLAIGAARAGMESGWTAAMGLCVAVSAVMLMFTGSKGAVLAAFIGAALALIPLLVRPLAHVFTARFGGLFVLAIVLMTLVAVLVRGTLLPESFAGDKSLLFRWHYTVASARMAADHPWIGVGPDGYQDAYTLHRVPHNPEEVQSAHSMFWDWITTLGIPAGAAWIALVFSMLFRSTLSLRIEPIGNSDSSGIHPRTIQGATLAIAVLGLTPALLIEGGTLDPRSILMRIVGIGAFAAVAIIAGKLLSRTDERMTRWCFAAAAIAVIIHGQIEMTFHQAGSVVWAMCALGLAGTMRTISLRAPNRATELAMPALLLIASGWIAIEGAIPAMRRESILNESAFVLRAKTKDPQLLLQARQVISRQLAAAGETIPPPDVFLQEAAARQLELAAAASADKATRVALLAEACDALSGPGLAGRSSAESLRLGLLSQIASITGRDEDWRKATDRAVRMTELDPHGLTTWRQCGDVLWAAGRRSDAAAAYQQALECDANFALDPLKQLSDPVRAVVRSRIDVGRQPSP